MAGDRIAMVLRRLSKLAVSDGFRASVSRSIRRAQAGRIRAERGAGFGPGRTCVGAGGRREPDWEPAGLEALPRHARPVVSGYYHYGGAGDEHETIDQQVRARAKAGD